MKKSNVSENNEIVQEKDYVFDDKKVTAIINDFCKMFSSHKSTIEKAIEADFKVENIKLEYNTFLKQLDNIKKINIPIFNKSLSKNIITGIGKIAVMYDGCSYVTMDMVLKALLTHNDVYLFSTDYMLATNSVIITLINNIIKKYNYNATIKHLQVKTDLFKEVVVNQDMFDELIYIGDKYEFQKIKSDFNKNVILKEFGNVLVYVEPREEIRQTLSKMDQYAYDNDINLEYITGENIEEVISKINNIVGNDVIALFTNDSQKAFEIISRVKAKKICINKNPFDEYVFSFDEKLLTVEKELIF